MDCADVSVVQSRGDMLVLQFGDGDVQCYEVLSRSDYGADPYGDAVGECRAGV